MRQNRVQHIAYCLKPTAHCCHNYYISHCCEHETIKDVFENIVHFLRAGWTHTKRKGCENTGSIGVGVSFVQAQNFQFPPFPSLGACLGAKGNFSSLPVLLPGAWQVCG